MPRLLIATLLALSCLSSAAEYTFTPLPESGNGRVTVKLENTTAKEFRMPAWAPGDYQLFNYGQYVESIQFRQAGKAVEAMHSERDVNLWTIPSGADEVLYVVKPSRGNFSPNLRVTATQAFVSGPGVFGWFEGDQRKKQFLDIALQPTGAKAYTTLDPKGTQTPGFASFEAFDYDEMIDAPFVVGTGIREQSFQVRGKPMKVVGYNQATGADLESFVRIGTAAAQGSYDLFGELPFPRYIFYCDFGGGGGGLEHLNSCRLGLSRNSTGDSSAGLIFHEFVHTYNVKRIRPRVLGPFDYTKPAITSTIWWLEGVTDYYAAVLAYRTGVETKQQFLNDMSMSMAGFLRNPNRLSVTADESSLKVWETRGSYGFGGVSYYEKGRLIGLILDLEIRGRSRGKHSLDSVIRDLYEETKNRKPGYHEDRIRELCLKYGGPEMGAIYDTCARQKSELPIAAAARSAGFTWTGSALVTDPTASANLKQIAGLFPGAVQKPEEAALAEFVRKFFEFH